MSRCKACNEIMTDFELEQTNESSGQPEDLCLKCLGVANESLVDMEDDTIIIDTITEDELDEIMGEFDYVGSD